MNKPTKEQWIREINERLKYLPKDYDNHCCDHTRLIAIQELLVQKGILSNNLILEKEWANDGFIIPKFYEDYENEEIMKLCRFKKEW